MSRFSILMTVYFLTITIVYLPGESDLICLCNFIININQLMKIY
jgi:hypothetical protein